MELFSENFDSGSLPDGWTEVTLNSTGINEWGVGASNTIGTDDAAVVTNRLNPQTMDNYDSSNPDDNSNDIILYTSPADAISSIPTHHP